ncbi:MAG: class I SAM-dependent methyltransferase [Hyphomicrobiaceae bacterium]
MRHFDFLYSQNADPWSARTSRNEAFKRRTVAYALGAQKLASGLEIGCGNGVSTKALSPHFVKLSAIDGSREAVTLARQAVVGLPNVRVTRARLPPKLVVASLDAVVANEVLYYLPRKELEMTVAEVHNGLKIGARLISANHVQSFSDCNCTYAELLSVIRQRFGREARTIIGFGWHCVVFIKRASTSRRRGRSTRSQDR